MQIIKDFRSYFYEARVKDFFKNGVKSLFFSSANECLKFNKTLIEQLKKEIHVIKITKLLMFISVYGVFESCS